MKIDDEELRAVSTVAATEARFVPFGGTYKVVPRERLRAAGWRVTKGMRPMTQVTPDTWVDTETGEIITKTEAQKRGIKLPMARSNSDKALHMHACILACTPSERPFVSYLLKMRNQRGGLAAPLDTILDRWIAAACLGIRSTDKARKRKQLRATIERRKLMVNDTTMAKDLMILNPNITKQEMIEEAANCTTRVICQSKTTPAVC
ncbi:hypothetical protein [Paraburkholderia sp. GAS32]|uniref:hypothetical protein n=1 Tax=Paraburkholderia sp. GAS32 TaxID=3035129 RepID=UPI003D250757